MAASFASVSSFVRPAAAPVVMSYSKNMEIPFLFKNGDNMLGFIGAGVGVARSSSCFGKDDSVFRTKELVRVVLLWSTWAMTDMERSHYVGFMSK